MKPAMLTVMGLCLLLLPASGDDEATKKSEPSWVASYDALLNKYVKPDGVRYGPWKKSNEDRGALRKVITEIGSQSLKGMSKNEKLAFYLNAYNAWILHRILQDYPTDGPGGGGLIGRNRFFKSKNVRVAGSKTSFHALENDVIRPEFNEPRIHFALNCASASCPPLHRRAFRAVGLNETLDRLTREFINQNSKGVRVMKGGREVAVSKIFDWYEDDFDKGTLSYINRYRREELSTDVKLTFQDYDWSLNESK